MPKQFQLTSVRGLKSVMWNHHLNVLEGLEFPCDPGGYVS